MSPDFVFETRIGTLLNKTKSIERAANGCDGNPLYLNVLEALPVIIRNRACIHRLK